MLINSEFDLSVENAQQALDLALLHEGSNHSWMVMNIPESFEHVNSSLLTGVESSLPLNSVSYFDHSIKVLVFIPLSLSSQGEHIDYKFSILLPAPVFNNDIRRVCPLFIYLVIWAPKDYIGGTARYFYSVWQVEVDRTELHAIEFLWNHIAFMIREFKAQKQWPVGLDNPIDRGIVSDTTCFSISRDIRVFENPEHEAQKQRPAGQNDKLALVTSAEDGFQRSEDPSLEMLSVDPPKLELSDLGDEFSLENFPFLEDADSNEI